MWPLLVGIGIVSKVGRADAGAGEAAEGSFTACAALRADDIAVAVDGDVDGTNRGLIHGGEIGVFAEDDAATAGMLLEIFLDRLFGLADVDGKNGEALVLEFPRELSQVAAGSAYSKV